MLKKTLAGGLVTLALAVPVLAFADTVDLNSLSGSVTACLSPVPGTDPAVTQQACTTLLQGLIAIVLQLTQNHGTTPPPAPGPTTGFSISVSPNPASQTLVAGTVGATVANYVLDNSGSIEDVRLLGLATQLTQNMSPGVTSCALYNGATQLTSGNNVFNSTSGTSPQAVMFSFDNVFTLSAHQIVTLTMKCNIPSTTAPGSFSWGLAASGSQSCGAGLTSGKDICPTVSTYAGNVMTVGSAGSSGSLSFSVDGSSPGFQIVAGGTTGVYLGVYKLRASSEGINLTKVGLTLASGKSGDLSMVYLYNSTGQQLGTATFISGQTTATAALTSPLQIPVNTDVLIVAKGDLSYIGVSSPATAGDLIKIDPLSAQGSGVNSGTTVNASGTGDVAGVRILRSYPTVSQDMLPTAGIADGRLIRFKISASPRGPIGISDLGLRVNTTGATVSGVGVYVFSDSSYSVPVPLPGNSLGLNGTGSVGYNESAGVRYDIQFNGGPLEIPAGSTYYFEGRGTVQSNSSSASIVTSVLGDTANRAGLLTHTASSPSALYGDNFVWSPNDMTTSQYTDADWTNGYGISGLPASGLTQIRSNSGITPLPPPPPTPTPSPSNGITITAGTQPPWTLAPQGAWVPYTKFTLTNTNSFAVNVDSMTFQWNANANLGAIRQLKLTNDAGESITWSYPSGDSTMFNPTLQNKLTQTFILNAGQSKTFTLYGGMASNLSSMSGQTSIALVAVNSNSSPVTGTLPIVGATNTLNSTLNACYPAQTATYGYTCWDSSTPTPPAPPVTLSVTTDTSSYAPNAPMVISWQNPSPGTKDWIGIALPGAAWNNTYAWAAGVNHGWLWAVGPKGSGGVTSPNIAGTYVLDYYTSNVDGSQNNSTLIKTSAPFTVSQPPVMMTTNKPTYAPGETMTITWNTQTPSAKDWIGLALPNQGWDSNANAWAAGQNHGWLWTTGTATGSGTLVAPTTPGTYTLDFYTYGNSTPSGNGSLITSGPTFTVSASSASAGNPANAAQLASALTALQAALQALTAALKQ